LEEPELNETTDREGNRLDIGILEELEEEATRDPSVPPVDINERLLDPGVGDGPPLDVNPCVCEADVGRDPELNDAEFAVEFAVALAETEDVRSGSMP
jgi:hypothetical protein